MIRRIVTLVMLIALLAIAAGLFRHISNETLDLPYAPSITFPVKSAPTDVRILATQVDHSGHAIAPGGIHTKKKLLRYYPFMVDAKLTTLDRAVIAHVTYRKNGKVYWTVFPKVIPAGTLIWYSTHGSALYACGNQVRYEITPGDPISFDEPRDLYPPPFTPALSTLNLKSTALVVNVPNPVGSSTLPAGYIGVSGGLVSPGGCPTRSPHFSWHAVFHNLFGISLT